MPRPPSDIYRFTEHQIGSIAGAFDRHNTRHTIVAHVRRSIGDDLAQLSAFSHQTGFTPQHLAIMLQGAGLSVASAISDLCAHRDNLQGFLARQPFQPAQIAAMLRQSGPDIGAAATALLGAEADLAATASRALLAPAEIATILTRSRRRIDTAARSLDLAHERLLEVAAAGLSPASITQILEGVGANAGQASLILSNHRNMLTSFLRHTTFGEQHVGCALASTRIYCGRGIRALAQRRDPIMDFTALGFAPAEIVNILNGSGHDIRKAIFALVRSLPIVKELVTDTALTPGALAVLLKHAGPRCESTLHSLLDHKVELVLLIAPDLLDDTHLVALLRDLPFTPATILQALTQRRQDIARAFCSGMSRHAFVDNLIKGRGTMVLRIEKILGVDISGD